MSEASVDALSSSSSIPIKALVVNGPYGNADAGERFTFLPKDKDVYIHTLELWEGAVDGNHSAIRGIRIYYSDDTTEETGIHGDHGHQRIYLQEDEKIEKFRLQSDESWVHLIHLSTDKGQKLNVGGDFAKVQPVALGNRTLVGFRGTSGDHNGGMIYSLAPIFLKQVQ
ncbi:hypothetical protein V495_03285 [Pseudogymnoascus sp. VKM F-4514 (FW-929)]|nr:hypothetical protein V495_03285 [Pseudogymnoascus sp. VKM F-4514 (FW-929)]KFY67699.1 hypothetical protein V497_00255 [Pseudogymnoascus sp. VKM F-4516 (FW-969)]